MKARIGEIAGQVWRALNDGGPMMITSLSKKIKGADKDLVLMALGWLAREDQIEFTGQGVTAKVAVRKVS